MKEDRQRIVDRIKKLAVDPRPQGCEKLSGQDKYRIQPGRYRILYAIDDQEREVIVVKVGHRKDAYR